MMQRAESAEIKWLSRRVAEYNDQSQSRLFLVATIISLHLHRDSCIEHCCVRLNVVMLKSEQERERARQDVGIIRDDG